MNKNYLVIGASSGIGKQLAEHLSAEANMVFGTYNKTFCQPSNDHIILHSLNVLDENILLDFLPDTLDGLVYCPGSIHLKPFERITALDFTNDFNLQVIGAIKIIQAVLPKLKKADNASIILFSSVAAQIGLMYHTQVSASKGAIEGLTRALAAELAPKIRVNCIAPSLTDTPLATTLLNTEQKREMAIQRHPLKKIGTPNDISFMAAFLLSEKAGWITGQIFHIDGGMSSLKI